MRKINKSLFTFLSLTVFLGIFIIIASKKIFPLLQHSLYYCQTFIQSLSVRIPHQIGLIIPSILTVLIFTALIKFFIIYRKTRSLRKKLIAKSKSDKSITTLLQKLEINNLTYLVESNKPFAFCFGIRSPKIYISTASISMMTEAELEAVLIHEKYHLDSKDNFTMLLATISQSLFPFFPLISDLLRNFRIEREIQADREVISKFGDSKVLISVLKKFLSTPEVAIATTVSIAEFDTLELRIKALVKHDFSYRKFRLVNIFLSLITILILGALIIVPVYAVELHDESQDVMMVCLQGEGCVSWCKENNSVMPYRPAPNASYPYTPANL